MHSLYPVSDKGLYASQIEVHGVSAGPAPSPCLAAHALGQERLVAETASRCCACLRYCNTIAVSELVSAGIGILDPSQKVEPVSLATLLLPRSARSLLTRGAQPLSGDLTAPSGVLRKRSFVASDFLLDSFLAPSVKKPVKRAASALACVDEELVADCQRRQWLRRKWDRAGQLAAERPPGLSVFHHPDDRCQCACHCLTAKYVVDELLHSGGTSTVFACRRAAVINPELFSRCYGHIISRSLSSFPSVAPTDDEVVSRRPDLDPHTSLFDPHTPADLTIMSLMEDTSSSTTESPTMVKPAGHSSLLISGTIPKPPHKHEPHHQAVRSACSWLIPIQKCDEIVIKIIHKNRCGRDELERCLQESKFLSVLHHRNIAKILASFDGTNELWMFFERATYTDLEDATTGKTYDEATVKSLVCQILLALQYIHQRRIIHCDVKPKNILLYSTRDVALLNKDRKFRGTDWKHIQLRLGDFGLAQSVPVDRNCIKFDGVRGSHGFFAPEVLLRRDYDFKIDVWAVGIIAFLLLVGYEPFYPPSKCIQEEVAFESRYWDSISTEARDFVSRLLTFDPKQRASADEALSHPWIYT